MYIIHWLQLLVYGQLLGPFCQTSLIITIPTHPPTPFCSLGLFLSLPLSFPVPLCLSPSLSPPLLAEEEGGSAKLKPYVRRNYCSLNWPMPRPSPFHTFRSNSSAAAAYPPRAETDFLPGGRPAQSSASAGLQTTENLPPFNRPCGGFGRDHMFDFLRGCAVLFFQSAVAQ